LLAHENCEAAQLHSFFLNVFFMALEEFEREPLSAREKGIIRMRTITNYGMGVFLILVGCFFMFPLKTTRGFISQYDPDLIKVFAVVCWLYGAFRIFRGYQKNYFRE
jgi:hypothetical protein